MRLYTLPERGDHETQKAGNVRLYLLERGADVRYRQTCSRGYMNFRRGVREYP